MKKICIFQTFILSFILYGILFWGCKKKDVQTTCTSENTINYPNDFYERFYFNDSSYWIFKDTANDYLDSLFVLRLTEHIASFPTEINPIAKGKCYKNFSIIYRSLLGLNYTQPMYPHGANKGAPYEEERFTINYEKNSTFMEGFAMDGDKYVFHDDEYGKREMLDSIDINGTVYKNVLFESNENNINPHLFLQAYYVRNIGLVRYKLKNNSIWNLVKYKIHK